MERFAITLLYIWVNTVWGMAIGIPIISAAICSVGRRVLRDERPVRAMLLLLAGMARLLPSWLLAVRYDLVPLLLIAVGMTDGYGNHRPTTAWAAGSRLDHSPAAARLGLVARRSSSLVRQ